jgi:tetratricopeptide (TPR) repeat protein
MNRFAFCLITFLIFGCSGREINSPKSNSGDEMSTYADKINNAFAFKDTENIESAIEYLDKIIEKEGDSQILSIYYDKAQLLYLQGKYNDALMTINLTNIKIYDVQKAALYISIGDIKKAEILLAELITYYFGILKNNKNINEILNIVMLLKMIYILSDKDINRLTNQLIQENILSKEKIDTLINNEDTLDKQTIIDSMWPR